MEKEHIPAALIGAAVGAVVSFAAFAIFQDAIPLSRLLRRCYRRTVSMDVSSLLMSVPPGLRFGDPRRVRQRHRHRGA